MERKGTARPAHAGKQKEVDQLNDRFKRATVAVLAEVRGMTVEKVTQLRADLRKGKSELKVVKNTLAKRALVGTKYEGLKDKFKGPVAVALSFDDVVFPAKTLDQFEKTEKGLKIIGGSMGGTSMSVDEVKELAGLPDLNTSRARLLGMFMQPAAALVRLLDAYHKKQGGGSEEKKEAPAAQAEAPAAAPAAPEASAAPDAPAAT